MIIKILEFLAYPSYFPVLRAAMIINLMIFVVMFIIQIKKQFKLDLRPLLIGSIALTILFGLYSITLNATIYFDALMYAPSAQVRTETAISAQSGRYFIYTATAFAIIQVTFLSPYLFSLVLKNGNGENHNA